MYEGSCLCGKVKYKITTEPEKVSHCYCTMCQKQHGAAFATYASFNASQLVYLAGEAQLAIYRSSAGVTRKFCRHCGSNIEWSGNCDNPRWTAIAIATLDTPYHPENIIDIHADAKACWLTPEKE